MKRNKMDEFADKMFLDDQIVKCTSTFNCSGCAYCESKENIEFMLKNQLGLIFCLGDDAGQKENIRKLTRFNTGTSSKLTVIFNNGLRCLKRLWGPDFDEIRGIVNNIMGLSFLPHDFIDPSSGTAQYYKNELLNSYLDKPFFPELSDIFRAEMGWDEIENPREEAENYKKLIDNMKL